MNLDPLVYFRDKTEPTHISDYFDWLRKEHIASNNEFVAHDIVLELILSGYLEAIDAANSLLKFPPTQNSIPQSVCFLRLAAPLESLEDSAIGSFDLTDRNVLQERRFGAKEGIIGRRDLAELQSNRRFPRHFKKDLQFDKNLGKPRDRVP